MGKKAGKIGIYGGSFNPPHLAHLILAEMVCDELNLDMMLFIPSLNPPHKPDDALLPAEERLRLTEMAVAGNHRFRVSDLELRREGKSYTVDTISERKKGYPATEFYLIVGIDNLVSFHQWREYKSLLVMCRLVALKRRGFDMSKADPDVRNAATVLDLPYIDISSTEIRKRIRQKKSVRYMIPDNVFDEINKRKFYIND